MTACNPNSEDVKPQSVMIIDYSASTRATAVIDNDSTLKAVATFPIGAAFNSKIVKESDKANSLFQAQFNAKTVHAFMNTEPAPGQFNFSEIDYWVNAADKQPLRLHGHCLVYHMAAPEWFSQFKGNTEGFEKAVKNHIQTLVSRYKGKIKSWDVINEVFDWNSGAVRQTAFRQLYASDAAYLEFVKRCFQWAHKADPDALLFYNDYGFETYSSKLDGVLKMIDNFKKSGTPIHGLGTQLHIDINTSETGLRNAFQRLAATSLLVHASELDIAVNPKNDQTLVFSNELMSVQAAKYKVVASLYKQNVPSRLRYGITMWSFSDADSWLVTDKKMRDMPNVFDTKLNKKMAFYGLMDGLK
ncbi:1,4-beta-xylanase [Spirosoma taeanense]|uniref:Beta-xylanase n=2 Tax=Spirosoma taeanense TaxID=2735870 RepID=A0A6M5YFZ2_9BACT|nr:1,4-beta-xylanase [Spirosoma taeanense]